MELLFEILTSILGDILVGFVTAAFDSRVPNGSKEPLRFFIFVVLGACAGALSTRLLPHGLITNDTLRIAWLIISPLVAAGALFAFQSWFFPRAPRVAAMLHAAAFSLTIALWRYFTFS